MSGGTGGRCCGGGGLEVATGTAKETRRFGAGSFDERQDCWRETDKRGWRTTDDLTLFGGRPLRGGSAACTS
jgi:hypothetical protein